MTRAGQSMLLTLDHYSIIPSLLPTSVSPVPVPARELNGFNLRQSEVCKVFGVSCMLDHAELNCRKRFV